MLKWIVCCVGKMSFPCTNLDVRSMWKIRGLIIEDISKTVFTQPLYYGQVATYGQILSGVKFV